MFQQHEPRVSIVTPVYNGEPFLAQCLDSILSQRYENWECTIVNNRSTDRSLEIATRYAQRYPSRIRVSNNAEFLSIIPNHNQAVRQISPESKYCKILFADDWLFPECLSTMVDIAERHPSVGIVGSYALADSKVLYDGLPYGRSRISGREICRRTLLGGPYVFGTPTTLLVRSDLVRERRQFFNEANLHADLEVCFDVLQASDFGFAYQVLSYSRPRENSNGTFASRMETHVLGNLTTFMTYGPIYLQPDEYQARLDRWMDHYYSVLAKNVLRFRTREFWNYHRTRIDQLNCPLSYTRLVWAVTKAVASSALHPLDALDGVLKWWPRKHGPASREKAPVLQPGTGRAQ